MIMYVTGRYLWIFLLAACGKEKIKDNTGLINPGVYPPRAVALNISTDMAMYNPGAVVTFTIDQVPPVAAKVRYKSSGIVLKEETISSKSWTWTAPSTDFTGYMVEISETIDGIEKTYGAIAVDISSDPSRFPRNGFLSAYGLLSGDQINSVMSSLNRYHMNYVQFQDWEYEHHHPLSGTVASPDVMWKDIANRDNYFSTVKGYNDAAHGYNMKTLSYNLAYGALNDAAAAGVSDEWYLFDDKNHITKEVISLPAPPFKSSIYIVDPSNTNWQQYIGARTQDAFSVFGFDGYQIDQVGNRNKTLYNYSGNPVDLPSTFGSFITAMKNIAPQKRLVMNAVTQYGQQQIAATAVDFLYSEVWAPQEAFSDLGAIIQSNDDLTAGSKRSVLAAYMNYNLAEHAGFFNTPGVVLADAVIFAFGGSHLELGDHMLGKEYFPNDNLLMPEDLKAAMTNYYDFLTGYENLLRDGGNFNSPTVSSTDNKLKLNNWPPQIGQASVIGKDLGSRQVIHLINFTRANSLQWRDADGTQLKPASIDSAGLQLISNKTIRRIWFASPDINNGASREIPFTQTGSQVAFILPSLLYWDMIVIEYQ